MSRMAKDICDSVRNEPWRWRIAPYTYERDDGVAVWRANMPLLDISVYQPFAARLGFPGKVAVYFAFRRWLRDMPLTGYAR